MLLLPLPLPLPSSRCRTRRFNLPQSIVSSILPLTCTSPISSSSSFLSSFLSSSPFLLASSLSTGTLHGRYCRRRLGLSYVGTTLVVLLALPFITHTVQAVDRLKFRTCGQTSFCRRHRGLHSSRLYEYRILPDSVRFYPDAGRVDKNGGGVGGAGSNGGGGGGGDAAAADAGGTGSALWRSVGSVVSRALGTVGSGASLASDKNGRVGAGTGAGAGVVDPHVRGPPPFFTALLANVASATSSGKSEYLNLSVHLHSDGTARMRITERYGEMGTMHEEPRWTSDELVLTPDSMLCAETADIYGSDAILETVASALAEANVSEVSTAAAAPSDASEQRSVNDDENKSHEWDVASAKAKSESIISPLLHLLTPPPLASGDSWGNYVALRYGGGDKSTLSSSSSSSSSSSLSTNTILIRLSPFALHLFRDGDAKPAVSVGDGGMMHFEIRRSKDRETDKSGGMDDEDEDEDEDTVQDKKDDDGNGGSKQDSDAHQEEKHEKSDNDETKKNTKEQINEIGTKQKEIVGYWEDGLAIYSDGTREERSVVQDVTETEHRKLLEEQSPELDREGMYEENFGSHHDDKPHGPMSVGLDVAFPYSRHLFGLPEHATGTVLQTTHGEQAKYHDPYRLYNLDVFEYELDETMALYGHIPMIVAHDKSGGTSGVFWFNPTETFVDIYDDAQSPQEQKLQAVPRKSSSGTTGGMRAHWMSESGVLDLFLLPGPTAPDLYGQYARLTGYAALPPMFSLGYHQCRWNYRDESDVYAVHGQFEELDYPYDVLWLDIEHTDGKRYFTWDKNTFPDPKKMQETLWSQGRRMVTIIDPHIKRDDRYYIHKEATAKGLYIKDNKGDMDYDGWCWPGSSSYLDFTSDRVRSWWADQFAYDKYRGSTPSLFTWNDMNEPSVFNGPEVSMSKDLLNLGGVEHREWHNLYGMLFHRATAEGLIRRNSPDKNVRPFVLSRSFFAGSQRYGAIWTGDNTAEWSHLQIATPMLLGMNVAALPFVGADVGGFFGNPDAELMTRWMQAGAYTPFFRGHAHHDSKRREPWMFGEEWMRRMRRAAMERYALLPYWYTVFWTASKTGMPVMRTMWMQYPKTESLFATDDQYLVGSDILVKPVTIPGATRTTVSFPAVDSWYDVRNLQRVVSASATADRGGETRVVEVDCPIDVGVPAYQKGGSVVPRKLRLRRSSALMTSDPYTLYIALNSDGEAEGVLYMDDETSFDHDRKNNYGVARFRCGGGFIRNKVEMGAGWWFEGALTTDLKKHRMVERIVVMGVEKGPKEIVFVGSGSRVDFEYKSSSQVLVIRKPEVSALDDWEMRLVV